MGAAPSTIDASTMKVDVKGTLTPELFIYIMDNYMLATRLFFGTKKFTKVNKDEECYQRYFVNCGKESLKKLKRHGISSIEVCMSDDFSTAMYVVNKKKSNIIEFNKAQQKQLEAINKKLQKFNGYGSMSPCYTKKN